jgi:hypothetical protein
MLISQLKTPIVTLRYWVSWRRPNMERVDYGHVSVKLNGFPKIRWWPLSEWQRAEPRATQLPSIAVWSFLLDLLSYLRHSWNINVPYSVHECFREAHRLITKDCGRISSAQTILRSLVVFSRDTASFTCCDSVMTWLWENIPSDRNRNAVALSDLRSLLHCLPGTCFCLLA